MSRGAETRRRPLDVLDRRALRLWAVLSRAALAERREEIDALNVYPVPDGDTGTNMYLTIDAAVEGTVEAHEDEELTAFARATVLGARGNSGVIVSQLVRGLLDVIERPARAGGADGGVMAQAFRRASDLAYACVGDPAEGTILTVARQAAEAAEARARQAHASLSAVIDAAVTAAKEALERTPSQLAALRSAGVVDAGATGLVIVLDALKRVVDGGHEEAAVADVEPPLGVGAGEVVPADYDGPRYEIVHLLAGGGADELRALQGALMAIGDSVVVAGDGAVCRVHAHVDDPQEAQRLAAEVGEVSDVTITDLHRQAAAVRAAAAASSGWHGSPPAGETGPLVLVCTDGDGLRELFTQEGAVVVSSAPGARASVGAILEAARVDPQRPVLILPNDGDVLLAATAAAAELRARGRPAAVVPTRSDVAGLAALAVLDRAAELDDAQAAMLDAVQAVRSGAVATASRDARTPAGPCRAGDVLGLDEEEIVLVGTDPARVALALVERMLEAGGELVTLVAGAVSDEVLVGVQQHCAARHPQVDVVTHPGGQPAYLLLVGVE
ncbi:DAK2 domain-containing protein [Arsenicicoccus sp. oral taxon 190]|uniref:DAK2 domain-containing protein n=1 Tax=Arsenicicoccus sp. oral taxon 190 TaxID=1658671 RepID=UPI00067A4001|nr:DAK2 domain-containing protein [Arsenicicoccus sp. oral taxon 190]AKT52267.1 hypothetical protein ADJ73_15090 [Arsenicicoccus sp. oral taxon 190]